MTSKIFFLFSLLLIGSTQLFAQQTEGPLDGKQYKIELFVGGKSDSKETLVFDKGMMDPVDCHQWGFSATKYEGKKSAEWSSFHVTSKSDKEGTMIWQGKITADQIDGTVVWSKPGQDPITYTFKGKEAAPEK